MSPRRSFRVIFLGERRIAWEVLKSLISEEFASSFDIRTLVTDEVMCAEFIKLTGRRDLGFVRNDARRSKEILVAVPLPNQTGNLHQKDQATDPAPPLLLIGEMVPDIALAYGP